MGKPDKRILVPVVVLLLALGVWAGLEWRHELKDLVNHVMAVLRAAGPLVFFGAMALLPLGGFPLAPFTLAAGPVFGPQLGAGTVIAAGIAAVTVNVALSYWISAYALRPAVVRLLGWFGRKMPEVPVGSLTELTLVLRVVPGTPFFVQSYLLGLARVPFVNYMVISVLVPAAYITGVVLAGDAIGRGDHSMLMIGGIVCAVAGLALHFLRKYLTRKFKRRREAAAAGVLPGGDLAGDR
jgi:uncharacterized membrane protein YdjX (TVP38/TMEM64 family)